jgi:hypothetical protein
VKSVEKAWRVERRLGGELMRLAISEGRLGASNVRDGAAREPDPLAALRVVRVNDGAQRGGKEQRAGGSGAEGQRDDRGDGGSESGQWE